MSTELEIQDAEVAEEDVELMSNGTSLMLFPEARTPEQFVAAATEAANRLHDIVVKKKLSIMIRGHEHVLVEGWQSLGGMLGVYAVKDNGVIQLDWPQLGPLPEEPEEVGREPRRSSPDYPLWEAKAKLRETWEWLRDLRVARDAGLAYGYTASFWAVKNGHRIGWAEGRCTRGERSRVLDDDYAISGMTQARGQSRTLGAAMRFVVKLAGYEPTPAEEMPPGGGSEPASQEPPPPPYGPEVDAAADTEAAEIIQRLHPEVDGEALLGIFKRTLGTETLPEAAYRAIKAIEWGVSGTERVRPETPTGDPTE